MKYIIMCGGTYTEWQTPRQLCRINGETLVERTIRLLRKCHVRMKDIAISSNDPAFEHFGVPVLKHNNTYTANHSRVQGSWLEAFYPTSEPVTYLFGDVVFSRDAIRTIVKTKTDSIELFASAPPFSPMYCKPWAEPFALKVQDQALLRSSINRAWEIHQMGLWMRQPIMWELWQVIKQTPINVINYKNYTAINDFTCDIDDEEDVERIIERMAEYGKAD